MAKRKQAVLDDLKAADILTNLISVPRNSNPSSSESAPQEAAAATSNTAPNPTAPAAAKFATLVDYRALPPAFRNGTGIPQNGGTYLRLPPGGPNMYPVPLHMSTASAPGAAGPFVNPHAVPPLAYVQHQASAHAAAAGAAAAIATSVDGAKPSQSQGAVPQPKPAKMQRRKSDAGRFKPFHEERWDYMLSELLEFREVNGHCLVPHTFPPNPQLARWVKRQRRQYKLMNEAKSSTMTPERAKILEAEGFVWDSHDAAWKEKVNDLRKYRSEHGHCLVPSNYKGNPHLATWVKCQRRQYKLYCEGKSSAMNAKRIAELEAEGFCWEIRGGPIKLAAPSASKLPKTTVADSTSTLGAPSAAPSLPPAAPSLPTFPPSDSVANDNATKSTIAAAGASAGADAPGNVDKRDDSPPVTAV